MNSETSLTKEQIRLRNLNYCKDEDFFDKIKEVLKIAFEIEEKEFKSIEKVYKDVFSKSFYRMTCPDALESIDRKNFIPKEKNEDFKKLFYAPQSNVGVDLPVYITPEKANGKCVFIIGEDPLRKPHEIIENKISFTSPFSTHHIGYRENKGKIYWEFSQHLFSEGFSIYYTDIKKIWIKKSNEKKVKIPNVGNDGLMNLFKETLKKEIDLFGNTDSIIITFGKPAENIIKQIDLKNTLHFLHPSGSANGWWAKLLSKEEFTVTKINFMKKKFNEKIEPKS